jgi:ribonuclease HII
MPDLQKFLKPNRIEAGCDEAGRGCLAGPVFAAAVILPVSFEHPLLDDSKKLSKTKRDLLRIVIEEQSYCWAVASVGPEVIDEMNILNASIHAMHLALDKLMSKLTEKGLSNFPEFLLIDGHRFKPYNDLPHSCEIKGDGRFMSIAAASVLAKTHRDQYMYKLSQKYPGYGWERNAGYPTKEHRQSIVNLGITKHHRKSYRLLDGQMEIDFLIASSDKI